MSEDYEIDQDDPRERVIDELGEVRSVLEEILSVLKSRTSLGEWILVFIVLLSLDGWPGSRLDRWTDKAWYSIRYDTNLKNITVEKRPSDCDFLHAPIGSKGCKYAKKTTVFGAEERKALIERSTTPEDQRWYEQQPNSVTAYWEKEED